MTLLRPEESPVRREESPVRLILAAPLVGSLAARIQATTVIGIHICVFRSEEFHVLLAGMGDEFEKHLVGVVIHYDSTATFLHPPDVQGEAPHSNLVPLMLKDIREGRITTFNLGVAILSERKLVPLQVFRTQEIQ